LAATPYSGKRLRCIYILVIVLSQEIWLVRILESNGNEGDILMTTENNQGSGFSWFVAGLGLGALLGVLYAPKAGREVREDVANSARDGAEYLKQRSRETADQVAVLVEKGKSQVNDYVGQGKEYIDRGRAQVEQAVVQGRGFVQQQADKVAAAVDAGKQAYQTTTVVEEPSNGTVL
jgi:gas vesicle protein